MLLGGGVWVIYYARFGDRWQSKSKERKVVDRPHQSNLFLVYTGCVSLSRSVDIFFDEVAACL
jgi:hypothetical protein